MSALARKLLIAFASLGLAASTAATYVHYNLVKNPDYSSFCDVNATVSCKAAYLSRYGSVAGVPVAVGGVLFFAWVLLMLWGARGKSRIKDSAPAYIFAGSTLALAVVLYLAYASFFVLKEVCPLCVVTYVAVIGVFVISGGASSVPMSTLPKRALRDVRVLVATPVALVIALLFVAGAAWGTTSFPREQIRPASIPVPALSTDQRSEFERWWDVQPQVNVPFQNEGARVLIVEFADFQCPQCRVQYFALKPILDKYAAERPKDVKVILKQYPLNSDCNPHVPTKMHVAACDAAAAVVMARSKGLFEKMQDWLFMHQEELSPATVRGAAADVAQISDFDAQYPKAIQEVKTDTALGSALGVNSTPTFFINGKRIPGGGLPPQYFEAAIELELKKAK
jgi:uncharacterized membrane protein/predicted DsbA family dithiol-disulfide isomerase